MMQDKNSKAGIMSRFLDWRQRHVSELPFLFILATVVGVISGVCAFLLKHSIAFVSRLITDHLAADSFNWWLVLIPLAGLVLTGLLTRNLMHARLSHGVRRLKAELKLKDYYQAPSRMVYAMIASTVTLGFGGSAGSEGPIACTGAAIGGNFGRWFGLSRRGLLLMIGCGAGAGIAGIFKAPLGGALFTLEVLRIPMSTPAMLVLLVCTIAAGMTAYALGGFVMDVPMADAGMSFDYSLIWWLILLGVASGVYSLYYSYIMKLIERWLTRLRYPLLRNVVGGLIVGVGVMFFPSLYGEGYGVVGHVLNGDISSVVADGLFASCGDAVSVLLLVMAMTLAFKCFATSATNSGGGVSGEFAPTLFAGCLFGCLFAMSLNQWFGLGLPVEMFALFGMAGVMAGAIRAPLMALLLTSEMVGSYGCFLPLLIVSGLSFGIVRLFTFDDFYSRHADRNNGLLSWFNRAFHIGHTKK